MIYPIQLSNTNYYEKKKNEILERFIVFLYFIIESDNENPQIQFTVHDLCGGIGLLLMLLRLQLIGITLLLYHDCLPMFKHFLKKKKKLNCKRGSNYYGRQEDF